MAIGKLAQGLLMNVFETWLHHLVNIFLLPTYYQDLTINSFECDEGLNLISFRDSSRNCHILLAFYKQPDELHTILATLETILP